MSTIITRSGKGSPLTNNEMDQNLINLNTDKLEASALTPYAPLAGAVFTGPLSVPAGASGTQVPQAQEIGTLADAQLTTHYKRSNILGAVSQSSGVPTGAVIEEGSNANGRYVKFADGTQICTHQVTTSASGAVVWTFPAAFSAAPRVFGHAISSTSGVFSTTAFAGTTAVEVHGWIHDGSRFVSANNVLAIGRWF